MQRPSSRTVSELDRLAALDALGAVDMPASPSLDRICGLARDIFGMPIAYISVLDGRTQWLKARCGTDLCETRRADALCDHAIRADEVLVVPDTLDDERFAGNPLVVGGPGIRFYAGAPLLLEPGLRLGSLCVVDTVPREFSSREASILASLAEAATDELRRHRADLDAMARRDELARVRHEKARQDEDLLKQNILLLHAETVSASGSWEVDISTGSITWSDSLYRLIGADPAGGGDPAQLFRRVVHPDDHHILDEALAAVAQVRPFSLEIRIIDGNGGTRHLSSRGGPMGSTGGRPPRMVGILTDISAAKVAEAALRESEDHHRHAVELSPQIPWIADAGGRITEAGPRWEALTGLTLERTLGDGWGAALHPDDVERARDLWKSSLETLQPYDCESRVCTPSGDWRWIRSYAAPRLAADGRVIRWYGTVEDIHERRVAEAALRESEDNHRHAVELSPQIPWTADANGRILEAGPRWIELTGMTVERTLGHGWSDALHPEDLAATRERWSAAVGARSPLDTEYRLRLRSGAYRWFRAYAAPRLAADGSVMRWYGTVEDIHERRTAEEALRQSEAFSRSVLDSSPDFVVVLDLDGRVRSMNRAAALLLGPEAASGISDRSWADGWPGSHRDMVREAVAGALAGASRRFSARFPGRSGREAWWDVTVDPVRADDGAITHVLAISRDVTERERMRGEVEAARGQLAEVLESTTDNVIVLDREFRVSYMNRHARTFVRLTSSLDVGGCLWDAYPEYLESDIGERFRQVLDGGGATQFEMFARRAGIWLEVHAFPDGSKGVSIFFRDVTEARRAREEIAHLAHHDSLTGLANRASFNKALERAFRGGAAGGAAVLLLDLDLFKEVNDSLGHPIGDALLRQVAARLRGAAGEGVFLARLGGDEFALVMPREAGEPAVALARRLVASLMGLFHIDGHVIRLGASAGVAVARSGIDTAEDLFRAADVALYRAKAAGGGVACLFEDEMLERVNARQSMKRDLALALERGELELAYQPLLDLGSGQLRGAEALLRWRHPTRGAVSPGEFVPLAEETGLISEIGDWVLERACRQAAGWPREICVAVNVSTVQFRGDSLPLKVAGALARTGIDPRRLELEITESVLLQDSEHNMRMLRSLREMGVRIALDDFGTGFSSLSYLRLFPFDKLKLDRSFVSDIGRSPQAEAIIRAAGEMGRALSMTTTAEGVETPEQLDWLRVNGWSQAQGYLIGPPVEPERLEALLFPAKGPAPSRGRHRGSRQPEISSVSRETRAAAS
ncbi:EAL domain-containing protein [Antarcticirhabdus aurantiaca]|uniref:EAL domain-containing protein n=1 Tax=Antarcticirhabdus aurantiaca TaxID=2606717 RepID=A0ACD4NRG9_9HYPH|nr:EAL domain-containing protein [Antarcticirhabdus aurantiaca]WAJ29520.1 EAL domain-containing protein [Jeongeuplla avenae]